MHMLQNYEIMHLGHRIGPSNSGILKNDRGKSSKDVEAIIHVSKEWVYKLNEGIDYMYD